MLNRNFDGVCLELSSKLLQIHLKAKYLFFFLLVQNNIALQVRSDYQEKRYMGVRMQPIFLIILRVCAAILNSK
jgi:hypothetical protein